MLISPFGPFLLAPGGRGSPASVELQLHFDGSNGATSFPDNSVNSYSPTVNGNAQVSTAQSVYGGASGLFDGTGDSLQYAASTSWSFGTGDWTIEFRMRPASVASFFVMVGVGEGGSGNTGTFIIALNSTALELYHESNAVRISGGTLSANTWYAVAVSCVSGSVKMFLDGTQIGSTYTASTAIGTAADALYVGARSSGNNYNGYLDELRISKGLGRYTGTYTPAASAFPDE